MTISTIKPIADVIVLDEVNDVVEATEDNTSNTDGDLHYTEYPYGALRGVVWIAQTWTGKAAFAAYLVFAVIAINLWSHAIFPTTHIDHPVPAQQVVIDVPQGNIGSDVPVAPEQQQDVDNLPSQHAQEGNDYARPMIPEYTPQQVDPSFADNLLDSILGGGTPSENKGGVK